jgi:NTP pyrophosphatase (non-canonical NTP hydrolase)
MKYYIYHIPGKKIGVTTNLERRVEQVQGYGPGEYEVLGVYDQDEIEEVALMETHLQKEYGYRVDEIPYNKLNFNKKKNKMNINITEQTTTFPCPVNKLKGQLMDNVGLRWMTEHGEFIITNATISWIMTNVKTSMYDDQRSYVYNKAFARFYDNHDQYEGKTLAGGLMNDRDYNNDCSCESSQFDLIRDWAEERGLYENGDTKTQALKLVEEVGETCRAILKEDHDEVIDGIGDCVVVLTNLAELQGVSIEECIDAAYSEIKNRKGKMVNGTYKKD